MLVLRCIRIVKGGQNALRWRRSGALQDAIQFLWGYEFNAVGFEGLKLFREFVRVHGVVVRSAAQAGLGRWNHAMIDEHHATSAGEIEFCWLTWIEPVCKTERNTQGRDRPIAKPFFEPNAARRTRDSWRIHRKEM